MGVLSAEEVSSSMEWQKKGCSGKTTNHIYIYPSIFEARCSGLEQTVVLVVVEVVANESYNISFMALYIRLRITAQTDC